MAMPKLRFKEFDGNWKNYKLEDISNIKTGPFGSNLHKEDYVAVGTPIITVEHLGEISLTTQNLPLVSDTDKLRLSAYSLQEGDIAFSRVGSVDRCAIVTKQEKGWLFSGRILRVRPNNKIVFSKHLMYALKTEHSKHQIRSAAVGQTMPSLNTKILKEFIVCLSNSLEEQTKIATFLSAVDTKIDELTQKHELLTDYKKGMMHQIFSQKVRFKGFSASWNDIKVGSLGTFNSGGTPSKKNSAYWKGDIPWISSSDLTEDSIFEVMTTRYITREAIDNSATKIIPKNSVLIVSRVGVGKVAVNSSQLCTSQDFTSLTPFEDNPVFLAYLLKSKASRLLEFNQGTSIKGFVRDDLINFSVSIPTKEEQTKIADFLTTIDQKIDNVAEQIDHAKTWKKGLLQQMFV